MGSVNDGASNMSGPRSGVAKQLCDEEPRALYLHLGELILRHTDNLSKALQSTSMSAEGVRVAGMTIITLQSLR